MMTRLTDHLKPTPLLAHVRTAGFLGFMRTDVFHVRSGRFLLSAERRYPTHQVACRKLTRFTE